MNDSPHGASVVPSVAVTITIASPVIGMLGTTVPRSAAAQSAAAAMNESVRRVRADIVARIVQRINQSLSAPLMIVLGAVLAVALRGTNPLQVYLLAFLPAILAILLVSGGEQMLKEKTSLLGILVASLGNIGLLSMIVFAARKVARH